DRWTGGLLSRRFQITELEKYQGDRSPLSSQAAPIRLPQSLAECDPGCTVHPSVQVVTSRPRTPQEKSHDKVCRCYCSIDIRTRCGPGSAGSGHAGRFQDYM